MAASALPDSAYAARRLLVSLLLMTIGSGGLYVVVTVLPTVQAELGVAGAPALLPYALLLLGFGFGGILMGRLADRRGVMLPGLIGAVCVALGFTLASQSPGGAGLAAAHFVLIGLLGSSASFAPLIADTSLWFVRYRGAAVAACATGSLLAGVIWPPVASYLVQASGWRTAYLGIGVFCAVTMCALALLLRGRPPTFVPAVAMGKLARRASARPFGMSATRATVLLSVAALAGCVATAMLLVHVVAVWDEDGIASARGGNLLSLMLGLGIASRILSGLLLDRIGGLWTLLIASMLQCVALVLFVPGESESALHIAAALFGLFHGGIVPAYVIVVREYFSAKEAGLRVGSVLMAALFGIALGGWMGVEIQDVAAPYDTAFWHGIAWSLASVTIVLFLIRRVALQQVALGKYQPMP